jgi:hypothetical protein
MTAHISKFLARDITVSIDNGLGSGAGGSYTQILGLNTISHAPSSVTTDVTDFQSAGHAEHIMAQRGDEWTLSGHVLMDIVAGTRDPGQALVETLAQAVGVHAQETFQIANPGGHTITFKASAEVTLQSGGHNDASTWQVKLMVTGAVTYA